MKPGYKQTEVGVIPEDWGVKKFCEIGSLTKGKGLLKEDIKRSGSTPAIPYTALYTDFGELVDYTHIKWFIDNQSGTLVVNEPCLLLASSSNMEANTGKASALVGDVPVAIGREVIVFKTPADCRFISYLLSTPTYRRKTLALARGTTIKHLYPATFLNYQIAVPPLPEQRAIAEALSDVDGLLGGLDRLIAKKRDLKQAAMQQLLTAQTRLPGFHGEWRTVTLREIADVVMGQSPSSQHYNRIGNGLPLIQGNADLENRKTIARVWTTNAPKAGYRDDVILTVRAPVGAVGIATQDCCLGRGVCALRSKDVTRDFLFQALVFAEPAWRVLEQGSTFTSANSTQVGGFLITIPPTHAEQTAIAEVLGEMDGELAALEARREKTRALKQAMMHALLTGQVRLV